MNRNKVFADLKPVGDNKKHAFPFDKRDVYSIKPAMLNIGFVLDTIPDSSYDINSVNIIRTDAIQSTPFARMSANMEYHFVPYSQIFRNFEKIYYERGDQQRNPNNDYNAGLSTKLPTFNYKEFFERSATEFLYVRVLQDMFDLCKSNLGQEIEYYDPVSGTALSLQPVLINFVYQTLGYVFGETSEYRVGSGFILEHMHRDVHSRPCIEDILRNFDMLGYGNLEAIFDAAYKGFSQPNSLWYYEDDDSTSTFSMDSYSYHDLLCYFIRWIFPSSSDYRPTQTLVDRFYATLELDMKSQLFSVSTTISSQLQFDIDIHPTIMRMAAYLKIWSDFYRNSQYDVDVNYSYFFNYDYYTDSFGDVDTNKVFEMLTPRYRQWKKDLFTGGYPNAQFGSVAVTNLENPSSLTANIIGSVDDPSVTLNDDTAKLSFYNNDGSTNDSWNISSGVSALSIRQALAMQKYRETLLRAGNRLTSLQRAMFGDNSRYLEDEYCRFLNAYSQQIDFNSVPTTAEGNDRVVGELASNGVSTYGGNGFKFDSHDFGVIIGIQYVLPEAEYESYGIDAMVTKSVSSDFYKGAFQNLGLSPVFAFNYNIFEANRSNFNISLNNNVWNYLARYWEYKVQYDKVHGLFYNSAPWHYTNLDGKIGDFANYVTPRPAVLQVGQMTLPALYVDPYCVDSIFYVSTDHRQSSDPFKVNMNHSGHMVLPMSVIGLPVV